MFNKKIRNKFKKLKRKNVSKKKTLYGTLVNHEFMHIIILQPQKIKKKTANGRQATFIPAGLKLPKINKRKILTILSEYFCQLFTFIFFPIWKYCVFEGNERKLIEPPKSLLLPTLN